MISFQALMKMLKKQILLLSLSLISLSAAAQSDKGVEVQVYPTGAILGVRAEFALTDQHAIHLRAGYNIVRHRDQGKHEDERGGGFGLTLGYKRYFKPGLNGWFAGLRSDVWFNAIDWKDDIRQPNEISGETDVIVLQPTVEAGYRFSIFDDWFIAPNVAFGVEINAKTKGAEVGQGAILLLGIGIGKRVGG